MNIYRQLLVPTALAFATLAHPLLPDIASAEPRAHRVARHRVKAHRARQSSAAAPAQRASSMGAADPQSCPAPGHVGVFTANEYSRVISQNLKREIDICADLEFTPSDSTYISEGISGLPGNIGDQFTLGFQGVLHGRGHKISVQQSTNPAAQPALSLGFHDIQNATIEDLVLEVPNQGVGANVSAGWVIGYLATNVTLRNIELRNITTSTGLFADQSRNLTFQNIRGDVTLRSVRNQAYLGALAATCSNCDIADVNLRVTQDFQRQLPLSNTTSPTYLGGLVGASFNGFIHVRDSTLTGSLNVGYDRGMVIGAINGGSQASPDGTYPPADLRIDNVRVFDADLTIAPGARSYTAGGLAGRTSAPTMITRSVVRDSLIEANEQAAGLIGGGLATIGETAVESVLVRAGGIAGGLVGLSSNAQIENSYFRGQVQQEHALAVPYLGLGLEVAGGILGVTHGSPGQPEGLIRRVYARARVNATDPNHAGALVGNHTGSQDPLASAEFAYYDSSLAMQGDGLGTALTSAQMLQPASFVGFEDAQWSLIEGIPPILRNRPTQTIQDLFNFLTYYFAQDPRADNNQNGTVELEDLFVFLQSYFAR